MNSPSITTHLQATKEFMVTAVPIQSLEAFVKAEVPEKIIKKEEVAEEQTLEIPTQLDEVNKAAQETPQSPYDTESEIKVVKSFFTSHLSEVQDQTMNDYVESARIQEDSDSDLQSMPDDDLRSVSGFEAADSDDTNDNKVSHSAHTSHDIASAERLSISDHPDHICEEVSHLQLRLRNIESSIVQIVSDEIKFVTLQKELSKVIKFEVAKKVQVVGLEGVREDLQSQTKHISKYSSSFQDMQTQPRDVKDLLETAVIIVETVVGEKKQKDTNTIPAPTQGEQKTTENITPPEPSPEIQGELT
ncbi:hypothetical protein Tco_0636286 [Tanacetum coccineum]